MFSELGTRPWALLAILVKDKTHIYIDDLHYSVIYTECFLQFPLVFSGNFVNEPRYLIAIS